MSSTGEAEWFAGRLGVTSLADLPTAEKMRLTAEAESRLGRRMPKRPLSGNTARKWVIRLEAMWGDRPPPRAAMVIRELRSASNAGRHRRSPR